MYFLTLKCTFTEVYSDFNTIAQLLSNHFQNGYLQSYSVKIIYTVITVFQKEFPSVPIFLIYRANWMSILIVERGDRQYQ